MSSEGSPFGRHLSRTSPFDIETRIAPPTQSLEDNPFAALANHTAEPEPEPASAPEPEPEPEPAPEPKKRVTRKPKTQKSPTETVQDDGSDKDLNKLAMELSPLDAWVVLSDLRQAQLQEIREVSDEASSLVTTFAENRAEAEAELLAVTSQLEALLLKKQDAENRLTKFSVEAQNTELVHLKEAYEKLTAGGEEIGVIQAQVESTLLNLAQNKSGTYGNVRITVINGAPHFEKA